jgi:hypothetical protein
MSRNLGLRMALPFALFLGVAEVVRNWGDWGFTCAMFYMAFFEHLESLERPDHGPIEQRPLTFIIGILFGVTVLGFASSLAAARREPLPPGS